MTWATYLLLLLIPSHTCSRRSDVRLSPKDPPYVLPKFQPSNNAYPRSTFSLPVAHTVKEEEGCNQGGVGRGEGLPLLHAIGGMITGSLAATRRRKEEEEG